MDPLLLAKTASKSSDSGLTWELIVGPAIGAAILAAIFALFNEWNKNRLRRKGIARVVADDMRRHQSVLARAWFRRRWWEDSEYLPDRFVSEDVQRLATALKPREWATVTSALGWTGALVAARDRDLLEQQAALEEKLQDQGAKAPSRAITGPELSAETLSWIEHTYERLDGGRWTLRRQSAPIASRVPLWSLTRMPWREHGTGQIQTTEKGRAEAHGLDPEDVGRAAPFQRLTKKQHRLRRYTGVTQARQLEESRVPLRKRVAAWLAL